MAGAEFPVRAVLDDKGIDQLIAALNKAGKAAGMTDEEIKKLNEDVKRTGKEGAGNVNKLNESLSKTNKTASLVKDTVVGIFSAIAIQRASAYVLELGKIGAQADKVKLSFDKLKNSEKLFADLKRVTSGTVTDLQLMQTAVKADNFRIPLDKLASLLEFASLKATQTGQSVDYMVESIITGIGRKSLPILDNLQLSATEIREEVEKVGDFGVAIGNIVERQLGTMARPLDSTYTKAARAAAGMENLRVNIGRVINETGILQKGLDGFNSVLELVNNALEDQVRHLTKEQAEINVLVSSITDVNATEEARAALIEELNGHYPNFLKNLNKEKVTNEELTNRLKDVNEQFQRKILLIAAQEELEKVSREIVKTVNQEADARKRITEIQRDREKIERGIGGATGLQADAGFKLSQQEVVINLALEKRRELQEQLSERTKAYSDALGIFNTTNNDYFTTTEKIIETEQERLGILARLQERLNALKEQLNQAGSEREIAAIRLEIELVERQIKSLGSTVRNLRDPLKEFAASIENDLVKGTEDSFKRVEKSMKRFTEEFKKQAKERTEAERKHQQEVEEARQYAIATGIAAIQAGFDYRARLVDQEMQMLDMQRQRELENAGNNEDAKIAINRKFDAQRAQLMQKQAQREQQAALFQMAVSQGPAIAKTVANIGMPWAIPFIAAVATLFALQTSKTRAAQPPRFKDGVFKLKGPGTETSDSIPAYLSKNESVVSANRTKRYGGLVQAIVEGDDADVKRAALMQLRGDLFKPGAGESGASKELKEVNKNLKKILNKETFHLGIDEHGFSKWTQKGNYITHIMERRYRS